MQSGRFSVAIAVLLSVTVQDIRPNSQDSSAYYLANILQQLTQSNGTQIPIPFTLRNPAAPFSPPTWAVWVNGLWFMSLLTSLTCALLAIFVRQWARRYLRVAYPQYSPHRRARIRAFYANGVEKLHLPWIAEALPALLHVSFSLFLSGLSVFCLNVNLSIFTTVIVWVGICVFVYAYLTTLPFLHKDSPYFAPLSAFLSFVLTDIRFIFSQLVTRFHVGHLTVMPPHVHHPSTLHLDDFFSHSMSKTAEQYALQLGPEIDYDSVSRLFESLDGDDELERFFEGIPGLCDSKMTDALNFIKRNEKVFSSALIDLMNRTLSSNFVSEAVKLRRIIICTKAVDATSLLGPWWILRRVLLGDWQKFLGCIEFGLFVQNWKSITHPVTRFYAQCVAAITISSVTLQERDGRWFQLASGPLGRSKNLFQDYLKHRDSILLANAIFIVRQTIQTYSGSAERHRSEILGASSKTLESLSSLDLRHTSPDLQHEFCAVRNQLVDLAQNDDRPDVVRVATAALKNIRELHIGLHNDPDAPPTAFFSSANDEGDPVLDDPPRSYRKCHVVGHRPSQPVAELRIEEPALEAATGGPPTPVVSSPGMIPASRPQAVLVPASFLAPPRPAPSFPHPSRTRLGASHVRPQPAFVSSTPPSVAPTPLVEQLAFTLPVRQPALTVSFISGAPNEGVSSAPSLGPSGQAR
jgi:hypothetical protein